jgi:hypothetical protein
MSKKERDCGCGPNGKTCNYHDYLQVTVYSMVGAESIPATKKEADNARNRRKKNKALKKSGG